MDDLRSELEHDLHQAGAAGFSLDDLSLRRRTKHRNTRIVTAVVAIAIAIAGAGLVARAFYGDRSVPADEPSIESSLGPEAIAGTGPTLSFVPAPTPIEGDAFNPGVWFKGALYATTERDHALYRTTDGFGWERVGSLDSIKGPRGGALMTDGERLVDVSIDGDDSSIPGVWVNCAKPGDVIQVNTSVDGNSWTSAQVNVESLVPEGTGCVQIATDGPEGQAIGPGGMFLFLDVGRRGGPPGSPVGLWSPDGRSWTVADDPWDTTETAPGPVVATDDGFLLGVNVGNDEPDRNEIWHTEDGSSWKLVDSSPNGFELRSWDGQIVRTRRGVRTLDSEKPLIPGWATVNLPDLNFSEFGMLALPSFSHHTWWEATYSADGSEWARWELPIRNGDGLDAYQFVGFGDGFVVLQVWTGGPGSVTGLRVASLP